MNTLAIKRRLAHLEAHQYAIDWLPVDRLHAVAMVAKECVFKAQDELHHVRDARLARKLERRLAKVRAELEALDRDIRNAHDLGGQP